jgi:hypothetical protein
MIELQPNYARRRSIYDVVAELHARFSHRLSCMIPSTWT